MGGGSSQWLKSNLVALGSAAVFSVYGAGYLRTRSAAQRFADEGAERRPPPPAATSVHVTPAVHADSAIPTPILTSPVPVAVAASTPAPARQPRAVNQPAPKTKSPPVTASASDTLTSARSTDSVVAPPAAAVAPATPAPTTPPSSSTTSATHADSAAQADKDHAHYRDGTFTGWGTSRHGDIQASVEIKGGRIVDAFISICLTRYSCSIISALPPQVVARQSADVDFVSGATQSTNAFYYAVVEALTKAK